MISFQKGKIKGVIIYKLNKNTDNRGVLIETYRQDLLPEGLVPAMSYVSFTKPGSSRGPHEHRMQTDIFSFLGSGHFLIRLWDNRKDSSSYGSFEELQAGKSDPITLIIPPGVVHGYKNISDNELGTVINYPDRLYKGKDRKEEIDEIRYEDEDDSVFSMEE